MNKTKVQIQGTLPQKLPAKDIEYSVLKKHFYIYLAQPIRHLKIKKIKPLGKRKCSSRTQTFYGKLQIGYEYHHLVNAGVVFSGNISTQVYYYLI